MNKDQLKVLLPKIRNVVPCMIASEIVGVQPMSDDHVAAMMPSGAPYEEREELMLLGDIIHSFVYGYQVYDGEQYIPFDDFILRYGRDRLIK